MSMSEWINKKTWQDREFIEQLEEELKNLQKKDKRKEQTMKKSQEDNILEHLKQGNRITPLEALHMHGCMRLASRISDMKKKGIPIESKTITVNGKSFKQYWLKEF